MTDERVKVNFKDAVAMLKPGDRIHTFRQGAMALLGADWDRDDLLDWIEKHGVELAGEIATKMNHGLVGMDHHGPLFIETADAGSRVE